MFLRKKKRGSELLTQDNCFSISATSESESLICRKCVLYCQLKTLLGAVRLEKIAVSEVAYASENERENLFE